MSGSFVKISESIIQGVSASFGQAIYPTGGQWGAVQRGYQVLLVISGHIELRLEKDRLTIPAGSAILCPPHRKELFIFPPEFETQSIWCTISDKLVPEDLKARLANVPDILPISTTLRNLVELGLNLTSSYARTSRLSHIEGGAPQKLVKSLSEHNDLDHLILQLGLCVLHCFLSDRSEELGRKTMQEPLPLEKVRHHIHEHFAENLDLAALARCASVTPNHLIKLFRERAGVTPIEYLWQVRLDHAMTLLRESGLSISEIAYQIGFKNPFHFARRFRQRYGKSPRAFRQGNQFEAGLN